jgi:hypothetical protein
MLRHSLLVKHSRMFITISIAIEQHLLSQNRVHLTHHNLPIAPPALKSSSRYLNHVKFVFCLEGCREKFYNLP